MPSPEGDGGERSPPGYPFTREILARSRTIAQGARIRDLPRLLAVYGGTSRGWKKRSTPVLEDLDGSHEYHWYEHHGLGRYEAKRVDLPR